jgi:CubicO group peptidase (beta-lactamase class C family)
MMMVDRGVFAGKRIVSESWIDASWRKLFPIYGGTESYGYLWYPNDVQILGETHLQVAGYGNGGQRLFLVPDLGIACVIFCGRYDGPDQWVTPNRVWKDIVLKNLER